MIIFPAIDIYGPEAVKFSRKIGRPGLLYGKAEAVVDRWCAFKPAWLHIVDLHGALGLPENPAMRTAISAARAHGVKIQLGGGLRTDEAVARMMPLVDRAIVSTRAVRDPAWLKRMADAWPGRLVLALDAYGDKLALDGWKTATDITCADAVAAVRNLPLAGYMYTNLHVEGEARGLAWDAVEAFARLADRPVVYSGGVTTLDDVRRLRELGAYGLVLGTAIYSGTIDLALALNAQ